LLLDYIAASSIHTVQFIDGMVGQDDGDVLESGIVLAELTQDEGGADSRGWWMLLMMAVVSENGGDGLKRASGR